MTNLLLLLFITQGTLVLAGTDEQFLINASEKASQAAADSVRAALETLDAKPNKDVEILARAVIDQAQKIQAAPAVKEDLTNLQTGQACGGAHKGCPKQPFDQSFGTEKLKTPNDSSLLIFVSASLPKESLRALYQEAATIGAQLVFRGLIGDSFKQTQVFFQEAQIVAEINPEAFEEYQVKVVPTFILKNDKSRAYDSLQGHISLDEALAAFRHKGELKAQAKRLSRQLQGAHP